MEQQTQHPAIEEIAEFIFLMTAFSHTTWGTYTTWNDITDKAKAHYRNMAKSICVDLANEGLPPMDSMVSKTQDTSSLPVRLRDMPIEQLGVSVRTINSLRRGSITTVGELIAKKEQGLLALHGFGLNALYEVKSNLEKLGFQGTL